MTLITLPRAAFAAMVIAGLPATAAAQATPPSGTMGPGMMGQSSGAQPGQPGMMQPRMMGQGMTGMHGPMMKILFAIADANGDGGLSFDEVTAIHKRIFDRADANKDGKVTPEEMQAFMRE